MLSNFIISGMMITAYLTGWDSYSCQQEAEKESKSFDLQVTLYGLYLESKHTGWCWVMRTMSLGLAWATQQDSVSRKVTLMICRIAVLSLHGKFMESVWTNLKNMLIEHSSWCWFHKLRLVLIYFSYRMWSDWGCFVLQFLFFSVCVLRVLLFIWDSLKFVILWVLGF